ncbi:MAG: hypothetical protein ACKKL4_02375 [Patescibacteria group bacterium]
MRFLIFYGLLWWLFSPIVLYAETPGIQSFARTHAPAYAQAEIQRFYRESDSFTKKFIRENWPRAQSEMDTAGIPKKDQVALFRIVMKESTWNHTAQNPDSSAYGYCGTMLSAHRKTLTADFKTNPIAQLLWCHSYAMNRYHGYRAALLHHQRKNWW